MTEELTDESGLWRHILEELDGEEYVFNSIPDKSIFRRIKAHQRIYEEKTGIHCAIVGLRRGVRNPFCNHVVCPSCWVRRQRKILEAIGNIYAPVIYMRRASEMHWTNYQRWLNTQLKPDNKNYDTLVWCTNAYWHDTGEDDDAADYGVYDQTSMLLASRPVGAEGFSRSKGYGEFTQHREPFSDQLKNVWLENNRSPFELIRRENNLSELVQTLKGSFPRNHRVFTSSTKKWQKRVVGRSSYA